jgi:hypothetical protein
MSTPPEELPAKDASAPKPPPRKRASDDGDKQTGRPSAVKSAADAPAPPRRPKRDGETAAPTAALKAAERPKGPERAKAPDGAKAPARAKPAPDAKASGPAAEAAADIVDWTPGAPAVEPAHREPAPKPSRLPRLTRPSLPKLTRRAPTDPEAASPAISESDAEAVLVDETTTKPPPRRFGRGPSRGARTVSSSVPTPAVAGPLVAAKPAVVAPTVAPGTGRTTAVRPDRQYRQTVTKVDLWSVTKLSLCFYLSAMFVTVVALVALWLIASAAGIIHSIEKFLGDLLSAKNFHFLSATVLRGAILVGLVVVALQVVITVISASFYNIFAELFGGVEITVREEGPAEYPDSSSGL